MFELFGSQGATDLYFRSGLLPYYFGIMWLLVAYVFYKFKVDKWFWFVFLLFMPNSFEFLGIKLLYRVVLIFYTLFMFFSTKAYLYVKRYVLINITFILWTIWFFLSCFFTDQKIFMSFSQYSMYTLFVFLCFYIVHTIQYGSPIYNRIVRVSKYFLVLQSILAIVKLLLWRILGEGLVGTLTIHGGAPNNVFPIVGFLLIWAYKNGKLTYKDWFFCLFLLVSPILGGKRSIWFFYILVVGSVYIFMRRNFNFVKLVKTIFVILPFLFIVFYFGVRLNPTLNPEGIFWGSFDLEYVFDYSKGYIYGDSDNKSGRAGMFFLLMEGNTSGIPIFGLGLDIFKFSYEDFAKTTNIISNNRGEIAAMVEYIYSFGLVGALLFCLFQFSFFFAIKNLKLRWIVIVFLFIEMILFYNALFKTQVVLFLLLFVFFVRYRHFNCKINEV